MDDQVICQGCKKFIPPDFMPTMLGHEKRVMKFCCLQCLSNWAQAHAGEFHKACDICTGKNELAGVRPPSRKGLS